jgi:hypothetical protein
MIETEVLFDLVFIPILKRLFFIIIKVSEEYKEVGSNVLKPSFLVRKI